MNTSLDFLGGFRWAKVLDACKQLCMGVGEGLGEEEQIDLTPELPRIIVIGDESSGKSSTLERVAMVDLLPRAHGISTRQPIVLKLRTDPAYEYDKPRLTVQIPDAAEDIKAQIDAGNLTSMKVQELLTKHMNNLKTQGIGVVQDKEIEVEVRSNNVPSLDLVDLPGLIVTQDAHGIAEATEELTRAYLKKENTGAVLCVVSSETSNLRTTKAFRVLQDAIKDGDINDENSIAVLAKADKDWQNDFEEEGKAHALWRLEERLLQINEDKPGEGELFKFHGFVAVKNRNTRVNSQEEMGLAEYNRTEEEWVSGVQV
jgi:hypothetical protein